MKFTICGSAKIEELWHEWNKKLGLMCHISYSLMTFPSVEGSKSWYSDDEKETLDLAHLAKIEESDAIFVINKDGYIGESTRREIKWAKMRDKTVYFLETHNSPRGPYEDLGYQHIPGWSAYYAKYELAPQLNAGKRY